MCMIFMNLRFSKYHIDKLPSLRKKEKKNQLPIAQLVKHFRQSLKSRWFEWQLGENHMKYSGL